MSEDIQQLTEFYTKKQVAEWLGCSTRNVELQVEAKTFSAPIRIGSSPRWRRSDLEKWLDDQNADEA